MSTAGLVRKFRTDYPSATVREIAQMAGTSFAYARATLSRQKMMVRLRAKDPARSDSYQQGWDDAVEFIRIACRRLMANAPAASGEQP